MATLRSPAEADAIAYWAIARAKQLGNVVSWDHLRWRSLQPTQAIVDACGSPRIVLRGGRRWGKTVLAAHKAVKAFVAGRRVLYATPTAEQLDTFWRETKRILQASLDTGYLYKNETLRIIERPGTEQRIRAKTAWNADTMRGDYADLLILDEWQLMNEDAWELVGAPMLLDNNGQAFFIYTPPSLHSRFLSKARDPQHAPKMFKAAQADITGRWATFSFSSHDNLSLSSEALAEISQDMTAIAYRQEIMAEDVDEAPGSLWTRDLIESTRIVQVPELSRVVVGIDPPGGVTECGIIVAGLSWNGRVPHGYVLADRSLTGSPDVWADAVLCAAEDYQADRMIGEANFGGDMVEHVVRQAALARGLHVRYKVVRASRGKAVRAEPVVSLYEQGRIHHVGAFPHLEDELCQWVPGRLGASPNRLDALVWAVSELVPPNSGRPNIRWLE